MQINSEQLISCFLTPKLALKFSLAQWSHFILILREIELLARFYHLSKNAGVYNQFPEKIKHHLHSAFIKARRQAVQAKFEAHNLTEHLSHINIKPIFLKGVAYTLLENKASQGRTYSDMDVLVNKSDLKTIERKLTMYGWFAKKTDDYDEKYYREWAHEIPPLQQGSRGTIADVHHNLIPPISGRAPEISLFTQDLNLTNDGLTTLADHSLVLHSIIHLFFNEDFTNAFRDITDLNLLFTNKIDNDDFWLSLIKLSEDSGFTTELYFALRYCQKISNTQFPDSFIEKVNTFKPKALNLKFHDFIFSQVLYPNHSSLNTWKTTWGKGLATFRGHLLKMPLHILIYHSLHKLTHTITLMFKDDKDKQNIRNAKP